MIASRPRSGRPGPCLDWVLTVPSAPLVAAVLTTSTKPKFPPSRLVDAFDQVVEPLITEITCLRSHELRLFHLVSAYIDSPPGELRPSVTLTSVKASGCPDVRD